MLTAFAASCSLDEDFVSPSSRTIHFSATIDAIQPSSRVLSENGNTIEASWAENEQVAFIYSVNGDSKISVGTVTKVVNGKATINAELDAGVANGAAVNVIYPASAADETTFAVKTDIISVQDGSLASISTAKDVRTGSGTLAISGGSNASFGTAPTLKAEYAICKFTIKNNDQALNVDKLIITSNGTLLTTVMPVSATSTLYVALKPSTDAMKFTATSNGSTYIASATAKLTKGHFYRPTMNMTFNGSTANGSWMTNIAGTTKISALSIPGAHAANSTSYTQGLSIAELWNAGVRAFDIHTAMVDNTLQCKYQGNTSKTVAAFFGEIIEMLVANPSEFALVLVYEPVQDYILTEGSAEFKWIDAFRSLLISHASYVYDNFTGVDNLDGVRGKIVLLSRPPYYSTVPSDMSELVNTFDVPVRAPIGGFCLNWNNSPLLASQQETNVINKSGNIFSLWTQDYCNVTDPSAKSSAITNLMDAASGRDLNTAAPPFVLNYTSVVASSAADYRTGAGTYNKVALDKLDNLSGAKGVGVVFMDYAGVENSGGVATYGAQLVQKLIDKNSASSN